MDTTDGAVRPRRPTTSISSRLLLIVLCVLLGVGAAMLTLTIRAEREAREQVRQTNAILRTLSTTLQAGIDAETGQRGYVLTGDPQYLTPYTRARAIWLDQIDQLEVELMRGGTQRQVELAEQVRELATRKLDELAASVVLIREDRRDEAIARIESDRGKQIMDAFRIAISQLQDEELAVLEQAVVRAEQREAFSIPVVGIIGVLLVLLMMLGLWLERRTTLAEAAARDAAALREARERSDLLARELNHRVKNLFAVILAIISRSSRDESDVQTALGKVRDRVHALSVAHSVSIGQLETRAAALQDLAEAALAPYRDTGAQITIEGPAVSLPISAVTPLGLILHELSTNAAKYGALCRDGGALDIRWETTRDGVELHWQERGVTLDPADVTEGFGSVMMRSSARQLDGEIEVEPTPEGLRARLRIPIM
ncbi:sensor histidine kinase [Pontivivens ytuae]|uniref:histidine kinase n=1 Tax=Pontivivens ytuae TaxID=2789856 RepID=A0A7S9LPG5_9RHOB|nr:CHASE3 domain-containing protein [Pontivivens ytuae]QPH52874.1 CHASE3 domain-containing protein [Pontivivens ytuae]